MFDLSDPIIFIGWFLIAVFVGYAIVAWVRALD